MKAGIFPLPFHRRILPWIFAIIFIALAPVVVFYTAGYRWNPKKGKIERNGTVLVDSRPVGASITIDGRPIGERTPVTIQNMPPGLHGFGITKDGYHEWKKSLDVLAEHVTFANDIRLWKDARPALKIAMDAQDIFASPEEDRLVIIGSASPTVAVILDITTDRQSSTSFGRGIPERVRAAWSRNERYLLLETEDTPGASWLLDAEGTHPPLELPPGRYRWEDSGLVGNDGQSLIALRLSDYALSKTPLAPGQADRIEDGDMRTASGTRNLAFVPIGDPERGFVLPPKNWTFWHAARDHILLRDGSEWLSLAPNADPAAYHNASGDIPRPLTVKRQTRYLLVDGNELWDWNPLGEPELLLRQSGKIVNAAWHRDGSDIFYATDSNVRALNLDMRDGRLDTLLAAFDRVWDVATAGNSLFIAAENDGKRGVWALEIE